VGAFFIGNESPGGIGVAGDDIAWPEILGEDSFGPSHEQEQEEGKFFHYSIC
jgi:hypothetical protein